MTTPTFFFSYARDDDESSYLRRFFDDLEKRVAAWAGLSRRETQLGTIDLRIPLTADWPEALANALRSGSAFVMAETPLYYNRQDCGRELRGFLRRSPGLAIDNNGALTGARNIFRVRWMPERAYGAGVPAILQRIEHTPPYDLTDQEQSEAIQRYVKKGMKRCVDQPHYEELLDAFALAIIDADPLPPVEPPDFLTEENAFKLDWRAHFHAPAEAPVQQAVAPAAREPEGLRSVVAFHITSQSLPDTDDAIAFADLLIGENRNEPAPEGQLTRALAELARAALEENLELFNVAPHPPLPFDAARLSDQLRALMDRGIITLLVVDPTWLLAAPGGEAAGQLRALLDAIPEWSGSIVVAHEDATAAQPLVPSEGPFAVPRAYVLPTDPVARAFELRRILVEARGRAMRSLGPRAGDGQPLPLLSGMQSKAA